MGKRLDIVASFGIFFMLMFGMLLFTGKDVRIISVLAAICALCLSVIIKSIQKKAKVFSFRRRRNSASRRVKALIYKENKEALNEVIAILKKKYPIHSVSMEGGRMYFKEDALEEQLEICIIRKYKASPDDILAFWREARKIRPVRGILFLIPGKTDSDVKLLRYKIDQPKILILDSSALKMLYRKHGQPEQIEFKEKRIWPIHFIKSAINRKRALRYLAYALLLTVYYLLSGNLLYLFIGAFLIFICLFSFFSNTNSDKLFS